MTDDQAAAYILLLAKLFFLGAGILFFIEAYRAFRVLRKREEKSAERREP